MRKIFNLAWFITKIILIVMVAVAVIRTAAGFAGAGSRAGYTASPITASDVQMYPGELMQLNMCSASGTTSDPNVAVVDEATGCIYAVGEGTCIITAKNMDGINRFLNSGRTHAYRVVVSSEYEDAVSVGRQKITAGDIRSMQAWVSDVLQ